MKVLFSFSLVVSLFFNVQAQDFAQKQLEQSPRHHEWVEIESSGRTMHTFVAYPEKAENSTVVIVIHENRGLNTWARSFADQIAEAGYIAVAPDMISNTVDGIEKTVDFESSDAARQAIYNLDSEMIRTDLLNVLNYAKSINAGNGKVAVVGFCWGGSRSFQFASDAGDKINAALVFYGTGPDQQEDYNTIAAPVYGFYGGNDQRVNSTIAKSDSMMKIAGNFYEYEIYEGAGHAFMRRGDDPDGDEANVNARNKAWERINKILKDL